MANDKIVNLAEDWMFKAIEAWQSGDGHPATCGNDSNHILVGKSKRIPGMDIVILACPECGYEQEFVPCVIYTSYLRAEIKRLKKELDFAHKEFEACDSTLGGMTNDWKNAKEKCKRLEKALDKAKRDRETETAMREAQRDELHIVHKKLDRLQRVRDCAEIALKVCKNPDLFSLNDRVLIASKLQIAMNKSRNQPETVSEFTDPSGRIQCITKQNCAICGKDIPINHVCLYNHKKQEFICMQCEGKAKEESEK